MFLFRPTDSFPAHRLLIGDEQRKLLGGLWQTQLPQQYAEDDGSYIEDHLRHAAAGNDALRARRISTWFRLSNEKVDGREMKKWNDFDEGLGGSDAENFRSHYNVLDQIGSNIIRKK